MVKIEFIKDFANKKKGDITEMDGMHASSIIRRGFAKQYVEPSKKKTTRKKKED